MPVVEPPTPATSYPGSSVVEGAVGASSDAVEESYGDGPSDGEGPSDCDDPSVGEWQEYVHDENFIRLWKEQGEFIVTSFADGVWRGYGFITDGDGFTRFCSFKADAREFETLNYFDGKMPMISRELGTRHQIRVLIDTPNYLLKHNDELPPRYQNWRFWHEGEHDAWEEVHGGRRYGDEIHLTTGGGGPRTG